MRVRAKVRRITGTEGRLSASGRIIIEKAAAPVVTFERCYFASGSTLTIAHAASRTFLHSNFIGSAIESTGTGDLFLNDVSVGPLRLLSPGQRVWARQLNTEQPDFINVDNQDAAFGSRLTVVGLVETNFTGNWFLDLMRETRAGGAHTLARPDPTLTYAVDATSNLSTWDTLWTSTGPANASGLVTMTDTIPVSPKEPRRFLRLRVTPS